MGVRAVCSPVMDGGWGSASSGSSLPCLLVVYLGIYSCTLCTGVPVLVGTPPFFLFGSDVVALYYIVTFSARLSLVVPLSGVPCSVYLVTPGGSPSFCVLVLVVCICGQLLWLTTFSDWHI